VKRRFKKKVFHRKLLNNIIMSNNRSWNIRRNEALHHLARPTSSGLYNSIPAGTRNDSVSVDRSRGLILAGLVTPEVTGPGDTQSRREGSAFVR